MSNEESFNNVVHTPKGHKQRSDRTHKQTDRHPDRQTNRDVQIYIFRYIFRTDTIKHYFLQGLNISSKSFKTLSCAIVYNISIFSYSQLVSRIKFTLEKIYDNCFFCLTFWNQGIDMTRAQKLKLNCIE